MSRTLEICAPLMTVSAPAASPSFRHYPLWGALLKRFYDQAGQPPPELARLQSAEIPQPYRGLLVHSHDMTGTLERFYGQPMGLTVLGRQTKSDTYLREVVLHVADDTQRVEYGVIQIYLDHFPPAARHRVLAEQAPLGGILNSEGIGYLSWPQAFFRLESDDHIGAVLRLREPRQLYGRRNVLLDGSRRLLAEVIEVLAPVENHPPLSTGPLL
jgi:hypothetical protein